MNTIDFTKALYVTNGIEKVCVVFDNFVVKMAPAGRIENEIQGLFVARSLGIKTPRVLGVGTTYIIEERVEGRPANPWSDNKDTNNIKAYLTSMDIYDYDVRNRIVEEIQGNCVGDTCVDCSWLDVVGQQDWVGFPISEYFDSYEVAEKTAKRFRIESKAHCFDSY